MSFGFSIGDITSIIQLTVTAYRGWKDACGEYTEITGELNSLIAVLKGAEDAAKEPSSLLSRKGADRSDLKDILGNLRRVVGQLNDVVMKFDNLGSSRSRNWDRLRFGTRNLESLRNKLLLHVASLSTYLSGVGLHALGPMSKKIDDLLDMKRVVDGLAEQIRAGMREGSIMTTYEDDEKVVWRQFRRELIGEGYRSRHIQRMKGPLKEYLRKLANEGLLDEASPENVSEAIEITDEQSSQDPESFPLLSGAKDKILIPDEIACQKSKLQDNSGSQDSRHVNSVSQAYTSLVPEKLSLKNPDTQTVHNLAYDYWEQGQYEEAERLFQQTLREREEKLGPKHLDTLATVQGLAIVYSTQGWYEESERLFQQVLQGRKERLGSNHLDTLAVVENLAIVYENQGRYEEAERLSQQVLQGRKERLGQKHPDTLAAVDNLAAIYDEQGRYEEAERLFQQVLQRRKERLGPKHPDTLGTVNSLAVVYRKQGRYEEAERLLQQALQGRKERLGPKHPDTLGTVNSLAIVYDSQDRYEEAERLFQQALRGREERLGPKHPDTLVTVNSLAVVYEHQGRYKEAEQLYRRALQGGIEKLGPKHPKTLIAIYNLAGFCSDQRQDEEADQLFQRALQGRIEKLGSKHPDTLQTVRGLANFYRSRGRHEDAQRLLKS